MSNRYSVSLKQSGHVHVCDIARTKTNCEEGCAHTHTIHANKEANGGLRGWETNSVIVGCGQEQQCIYGAHSNSKPVIIIGIKFPINTFGPVIGTESLQKWIIWLVAKACAVIGPNVTKVVVGIWLILGMRMWSSIVTLNTASSIQRMYPLSWYDRPMTRLLMVALRMSPHSAR